MILFEALVTFAHPVIGEHFQIIIHLNVLKVFFSQMEKLKLIKLKFTAGKKASGKILNRSWKYKNWSLAKLLELFF